MSRTAPLALLLLALMGGRALAHAALVRADPAPEAVLARAPERLWLRFNMVIRLPMSGVELVGPAGRSWRLTDLKPDPGDARAVIAPLPPGLPAGRYQVRWRALSPIAHHSQGAFAFTVRP